MCKQNAGLYTQGPNIRMMSHRAMSSGSSSSFIAALGEGAFRNAVQYWAIGCLIMLKYKGGGLNSISISIS